MVYNPSFSRNIKGKFNPELGFVSIKNGTDAYLLEDDLNELQWIQNEARAELIRRLSNSGCSQKNPFNINYIKGGLQELFGNQLNGFLLGGFDAILNGYLAVIDSSSLNGNVITLPTPPSSGTRYDFVFLEFWFKELKNNEPIKKFGGVQNDNIPYEMIDSRMGVETSRRIQLQWNIRSIGNIDYDTYKKGFVDALGLSNILLHPKCTSTNEFTNLTFKSHNQDKDLFIAGTGDSNITGLGTADGYAYAIPLFFVNRLNNGGYHEIDNPNGAINWVDNNSVSGRLDNKFANLIYKDQVIDVRPLAILAKDQLESIFVSNNDFDTYKEFINNNTSNILNEIDSTQNDISILQQQVNTLIDNQVNNILPRVTTSEQKIGNLQIDFANVNSSVNTILTKVNDMDQRLTLVENELKKLGVDLTFSGLIYYGTDVSFGDLLSAGGKIELDGTINCTGSTIASNFPNTTYSNYSILYTAESSPSGKLGDVWNEKADSGAVFKNSGYGGIKVNYIAVKNAIATTIGNGTFNSMAGTKINKVLSPTDFLYISPTSNTYGTIGEIYYIEDATGFTVYNTGRSNTTFDWIVIDTTQLRNCILDTITYTGMSTITGVYGEVFKAFIGPSNIPVNNGSIGDVTVTKSLNTLTVHNTGSSIDGSTTAKVLLFKDMSLIEGT
jgi:hypothetical protein